MSHENAEKLKRENPAFFALAQALRKGAQGEAQPPASSLPRLYERFVARKTEVLSQKRTAALKNTIGGRIGTALEYVTRPLNFDWRTNIALIGGFAAKEVVVATLGTAYSLAEVNPEETVSLQEKLKKEALWNPLTAFTLIMFVMLYAPCFVTLVVMRKETGGFKWPLFAMAYTTTLAYFVALVVHSVGSFLGIGL
jgi:ferrous iron transport protein B